jgi:hypothetical protein
MKKLKLTFFSDGGHGWLAVKRSLLVELGIDKKVSHCSYQKGETVYLEEDCDAALFYDAYTLKMTGVSPKSNSWENWQEVKAQIFEEKRVYSNRSSIRNYAHYTITRLKPEIGLKAKIHGKIYEIVEYKEHAKKWIVKNEMGQHFMLRKTDEDALLPVEQTA